MSRWSDARFIGPRSETWPCAYKVCIIYVYNIYSTVADVSSSVARCTAVLRTRVMTRGFAGSATVHTRSVCVSVCVCSGIMCYHHTLVLQVIVLRSTVHTSVGVCVCVRCAGCVVVRVCVCVFICRLSLCGVHIANT